MIKELDLTQCKNWMKSDYWPTVKWCIPLLAHYYYNLQQLLKSNCFIEIGACDAEFSRQMKNMFPLSLIYAFEANPYCYNHYKNINKDINYMNMAMSNINGDIDFNVHYKNLRDKSELPKTSGSWNGILEVMDKNWMEFEKIKISSTTFDAFIENNNLKDKKISLWIDVEGAAEQVLIGMKTYINNIQTLLIEVEEEAVWTNQWLTSDINKFLKENNFIPIVRDFENSNQYNIVYINNNTYNNNHAEINKWINNYLDHVNQYAYNSYVNIGNYLNNIKI